MPSHFHSHVPSLIVLLPLSILNLADHPTHPVSPQPGSLLAQLAAQSSPEARAQVLENSADAATAHAEAAAQGATDGEAAADTEVHYIALVERAGRLLELDGRKHGYVAHLRMSRFDI